MTVFTLAQLALDIDLGIYYLDLCNFSNLYGTKSTSLFHLSKTEDAISFDALWIGGLLNLFGLRKG